MNIRNLILRSVGQRSVFYLLMTGGALLKLLVSALVPASFDLASTVVNPVFPSAPWVLLEVNLLNGVASLLAVPANWWFIQPALLNVGLLLMFLRLPVLAFDLGTGLATYLIVARVTSSRNLARLSALIWFLNPYTFFAVEMLAVPDVAATFLTVLMTLFLIERRYTPSGILYAASITLKLYPIFLLPPLLIYLICVARVDLRRQLAMIGFGVIGTVGYLSWLTPYSVAVLSADYTPVSQPINLLFQEFSPGGATISVGMIGLVVMYALTWMFARRSQIINTILPVFLIYYTFTDPRPQYFLWCLPFLIAEIVLFKRQHFVLLTTLLSFVLSNWFFASLAFDTPSGYSFMLFPLEGSNLPRYSVTILTFVNSNARNLLFIPFLSAGTFTISFIYAIEIIRHWRSALLT